MQAILQNNRGWSLTRASETQFKIIHEGYVRLWSDRCYAGTPSNACRLTKTEGKKLPFFLSPIPSPFFIPPFFLSYPPHSPLTPATQATKEAKRMTEIQYHTVKDLYQQTIRAMCSFIKVLIYINKTRSGCLRQLKNQYKVQLGNPKSGRCCLREL